MPLDLHAIVDATIARESMELDERLAAAKRQQRKDEKSIVEQSLLQQYVEVEVAKDPTVLVSCLMTAGKLLWFGSSLKVKQI